MKKVLIANIFGIGDVLFTSPIAHSLRKTFPGISIDYLCNARTRDIVRCIPGVGDIFIYEKDDYAALWKGSRTSCVKAIYGLFKQIKGKGYDAVFDLTNSREFGFLFFLAGIPVRVGLDYKGRGLFLTHKVAFSGFSGKHVIEYYSDLLRRAGIEPQSNRMKIVPDNETVDWAESYVLEKGLDKGPFAAIIPGGGASWGAHASRKRWRAEGFARVAGMLEARGIRTVILGDASEKALCEYVSSEMITPPSAVENGLSLREYMGLLEKAEIVLCNDGGPLHMAVALGRKTVSVFGPVDEKVYGPYPMTRCHRVVKVTGLPCRPCYDRFKLPECVNDHRCVVEISPQKVAEVCMDLNEMDQEA